MDYKVDVRDIKFQLFEWLPIDRVLSNPRYAEWDRQSLEMVLEEALKIAQEQMGPANAEGDRIGAKWKDGKVTMPACYKPAYQTLAEGGWIGTLGGREFGGMCLPDAVGTAVNELFAGSNVSLSLTIMLTRGAGAMIEAFGTEEQKRLFVQKIYSGTWAGTMCLTESQAGSDVGASKTKAVKQADGSYAISGEKIFITSGEHDLTENIIHLVLARTPDAPTGTKGLSLFIIPKIWVNPDGSPGQPNDVYCNNIEEKMGIHGSPTCSLVFGANGGCRGLLLGGEHDGMKLMFHLMNAARIEVGLQGGAAAAGSYRQALDYAKVRLQSRHWKDSRNPDAPQVPIIEHPDVRRMLLSAKAYSEAIRAVLLQGSFFLDLSHVTEGEESERYKTYLEVLTPICKAWGSEWGVQAAHWCLQVFGGYGYTREYAAEQYLRDAVIACIYEGTNGIQALDFVARKLPMKGGKPVRDLLGMAEATFNKLKADSQLSEPAWLLAAALKQLESVAKELPKRPDGIEITLLNAPSVLDMTGTTYAAHLLLEQAIIAREKLNAILKEKGISADDAKACRAFLTDNAEAAFYHDKVQSAIHFAYTALPTVAARAAAIRSGERAPLEAIF